MKQFGERGLDRSGIRLIATGDVVDDDQLDDIGTVALGVISSHRSSPAIYNAIAATKGVGGGDALLAAMKGQGFESPRGQILIDAQTRDIVQDVHIRKVERVAAMGNQPYNVEFDVQKAVKHPAEVK